MLGLAVVLVLVASGIAVTKWSNGAFSNRFLLTIVSPRIGDGLVAGADVKFRGYAIGKVDDLTITDDGRQRIKLAIERRNAAALTSSVEPVFAASNMFATTSIELVPTGDAGQPLADDAELTMTNTSTALGTMTSVLSRMGKLAAPLSDPDVLRTMGTMIDSAEPYLEFTRDVLPLLSGLASDQTTPVGDLLRDLGRLTDSVRPMVAPMLGLIDGSLGASSFLAEPGGVDRTSEAILGLSKRLVLPLGRILGGGNLTHLQSLIEIGLDFGVPIVLSVGTIPNAYGRLTELIRNTGDAFQVRDDGAVRLLVTVLLTKAPQIGTPLLYKEIGGRDR
nr:MlaD family protein [Gordonia araii]